MEKSIHELITELCDKHVDKRKCINESINIPSVIKKLRIKAFEILLKKQPAKGCVNELEGNTDPICHLLAWQYTLKHTHNQPETAEALNIFIERIKGSKLLTDTTVQSIMLFLLYLRGKQPEDKQGNLKYNIFDKVTLKHKSATESTALPYDLYPEHRFRFTDPLDRYDQQSMTSFSTKSFSLQPNLALRISKTNKSLKPMDEVLKYSSDFKFVPLAIGGIRTINSKETVITDTLVTDEGYDSPVKECIREDIWEIASKMPVNEHRTWESLENVDPVKELAFACESGPKTLHDFEKILDANSYKLSEGNAVAINIICNNQFIKKLKYMLVGMASDEFLLNDQGMFYLREGVCVEGVSPRALTSYCSDLLCCGSCYRALHQLCSSYPCRDKDKYGYIFKELCESIKRYLAYYRVAALSVPDTASLLTVHAHVHRLRDQICALARMCRVGMFATDECQVPHGIELLNYMYQEIVKTIDTNVGLVLYSAFYPCCQVYFSRFLQRWLFEGLLIDPYEEFMVKSESHYTNSRARTYWTRSFSLRQNAIPDFLADLKTDILHCGKTMNLLKLCHPDAPLYTDIVGRSLPLISCCLTPEQVAKLRHEIDCYYIEMAAVCGPRVSLYHKLIERYEDNVMFLSLVEKKRALTIQKMELQKQQEAEEKAKAKRKIFEELREQMLLAVEQKKKAKEDELQRDLQIAEQNAQMEELRVKLLKEETQSIITYYHNLIEAVDKRRDSIEKRKQQIAENSKVDTKEISKNLEPVPEVKTSEEISLDSKKEENIDLVTNTDTNTNIDVKTPEDTVKEISCTNDSNTENPKDVTETENINEQMQENKNTDDENKDTTKIENANKIVETPGQSTTKNNKKGNLDIVNANMDSPTESVKLNNQLNENFLAAQRNKAKILNLEFGVKCKELPKKEIIVIDKDNLTDAQRNKLRVLSSEYNLFSNGSKKTVQIENTSTPESENGNTASTMTSNVTKPVIVLPTEENENNNENSFADTNWKVTGNLASPGHENVMNITHRKKILTLPKQTELPTVFESNFRTSVANIQNEVTPMSIDSTPSTECPPTELPTPSSAKLSLCTNHMTDSMFTLDSALLTANSHITDDGFKFPIAEPKKFIYETVSKIFFADKKKMFNIAEDIPHSVRPMRLSKDEVKKISNCNLKLLLYQSVQMPLEAQIKLVNGEILKYFINDQHFFSHLHSLRCYYFLLDGEFGRYITEGLFNKLYEAKNPADLLNCRSLQLIVNRALYASSKMHENAERLSFIVQNIPKTFDLSNADVLECLSLSYRINWPLNILLPCDTIEKYDIVFKYLLKLHYMSWILQKMCKELKVTQKEHGVDEILMMRSPQYHRLQLYRHIMTHFVQTLQNYTVSEVLQTSWAELENNMKTVNTLDQLYTVHILYVRTIIFRCLLNKKCAPIMKVINEIFVVILKFYNYLRSRTWNIKENDEFFTHPNFKKLEDIFNKFQEFTKFVFRVGNKMARVGYQPHLVQMLDMLNINDYYTNKQNT